MSNFKRVKVDFGGFTKNFWRCDLNEHDTVYIDPRVIDELRRKIWMEKWCREKENQAKDGA